MRTPKMIAAAAAVLALAVACTPASDQPSAEQALCDALSEFNASVQAIAAKYNSEFVGPPL